LLHSDGLTNLFLLASLAQDLDNLQSVFTAKPWRQGCLPLIGFLFSTKAALNKAKTPTGSVDVPNQRVAHCHTV